MNKLGIAITVLCWVLSILLLTYTAYSSTFGTATWGTDHWGTGTSTTSAYVPGRERNNIIGGGIVMLRPEDVKSNPWNNNFDYSLEYRINLIDKEDKG